MSDTVKSGDIRETRLADALGERYLAYAMSTIMSRSLPDVRDGLKPVHRRLLFAMRQLKLDPAKGFKKCARVVGDVIGKYHPHGDSSVYEAMVRLAQEFAVRYPLVDGQGNFGNIDGDNAAAMRYTEARLTEVAMALLRNIDEDSVDFRQTYDGEEEEPMVLPAAFPNLLANGSSGIAVGMATNIPPHNAGELCDGLLHLIKFPNAGIEKLVDLIPGPDFPTGGVIVDERATIIETYTKGKGSFRIRAQWEKEELSHGMYQIVVTGIPYQVQKSKLIEKVAELLFAKKLPLLADIRDESTEEVRIVLEPRNRTVEAEVLMEQLFKLTDFEVRFGLNMNVLDADQTPRVMNLREVLQAFLDHRRVVLQRRSKYRLEKIARRLEILEGYLIAFLNLDEVIRIIREEDHPRQELMSAFKLTEVQAEAILNMRLRSLRKLEEMELKTEHKELSDEKAGLEELLADETKQWATISDEIRETKKQFGQKTELGKRRTDFGDAPSADVVNFEAFIEREPITVVCSHMGWIRAFKGHNNDESAIKYKDGDKARFVLKGYTTDKLLAFSSNGRFFTIGCDKLPPGRGHGEPVRLMVDIGNENEIVDMFVHNPERKMLVASSSGRGFAIEEKSVVAQTKNGKQVLNLQEGEKAKICMPLTGNAIAVVGDNRKILVFKVEDLPEMNRGRGVILQKYRDGGMSDVLSFNLEEGISWQMGGGSDRTRTVTDLLPWIGKRAGAGRLAPNGFPRNNKFT
ncbi:DNA topoisomerase IV subunit A [Terasakiella sp. SH-1]|uniref:DNA topoisomerase IV subunit A n=1 Tax=Terasakiella sp. SH-1 TaxID=2560057 RepID=UPI00107348D0|nr:DNA topoisomerase IV subunit A [Terasakiella sp. SH-1]